MHHVVKRGSERAVDAASLTRGQMDIFKAASQYSYNNNGSKCNVKGVAHNDKPGEFLSDFLAYFSSLFGFSDPQTPLSTI